MMSWGVIYFKGKINRVDIDGVMNSCGNINFLQNRLNLLFDFFYKKNWLSQKAIVSDHKCMKDASF